MVRLGKHSFYANESCDWSMQFIFGDDLSDTPSWSRFAENDLKSKYPEDYSTVDKKRHERLTARKSCLEESIFYGRFTLVPP